ncbi:MAG: SMC-Scp complex subunit ScpB [Oscillibacter sp.]|nr:SMC-Scp complex subunit ScpB [Oscillibacter sp.]
METADTKELESAVEGILFASGEPIGTDRICFALSVGREEAERALRRLRDYYAFERRGMRLLQLEDKWQLCSSPDCADAIRKAFEIRKPAKLSQPALEALTIIAYYQPTTRAYVDKLRGVDSAYTVGLLLERGLIETCGNLQAPGRPLLYRTTEKFLRSFHISSLDELPPLDGDEVPPQQLKIEDMAKQLTEAPESASPTAESVPDAALQESETPQEPQAPDAAGITETAQAGEETEVPESKEIAEEPQEAASEAPEISEGAAEATEIPARELMAAGYPLVLTAPGNAPRRARRKPAPRKPKRLAETFRTRRPRRQPRKRRKVARPRRAAPPTVCAAAPEICGNVPPPFDAAPLSLDFRDTAATESAPASGNGAKRRKLSGKTVRRCFHCLLFGCWLSWPFF